MAVLDFVEHSLNGFVIVRQRLAHARRQAGIVDQVAQAFTSQRQVPGSDDVAGVSVRRFFGPGPIWQCGERPLQYAH